MFGQLSGRERLRDLIAAVEAHSSKAYHLGFGKSVTRSNLAKENQNIELCLAVFCWATFRKKKGGVKVHTPYDIETQFANILSYHTGLGERYEGDAGDSTGVGSILHL